MFGRLLVEDVWCQVMRTGCHLERFGGARDKTGSIVRTMIWHLDVTQTSESPTEN
ncbi:hypothetical protein IFT82_11310 [Sphingomonas sp. CFBP 8760]|nr:hypothetical protein [Sphingomonas sp. CFBP 8760]